MKQLTVEQKDLLLKKIELVKKNSISANEVITIVDDIMYSMVSEWEAYRSSLEKTTNGLRNDKLDLECRLNKFKPRS